NIPFVHQRIAEIRLHAAHGDAGVQRERAKRISTGKAAGHEIAVEALRLAYAHKGAVALVARQIHGLIERHSFAAIGAAALVLFTAIENSVSKAKNGPVHYLIGDAEARSDGGFVPGNQIVVHLPAGYRNCWEQCPEVRRKSSVLIPAGG